MSSLAEAMIYGALDREPARHTHDRLPWTDDRIAELKKLWAEGLSASAIAARLGGVTRNAVIGKIHRLGLEGRQTPRHERASMQRKRRVPRSPRTPRTAVALPSPRQPSQAASPLPPEGRLAPLPEPPTGEGVTFTELKGHHCRWPIGEPGAPDFRYCGCKKIDDPEIPYCHFHDRVGHDGYGRRGGAA